ncbi:MAG: STAS domain-containing protein [Candidatus Margulisbacteria bacterium]|nr:STAS domain-containing protein [Candidatus Margulisiibacteriota bacterium]
MLFSKVISTKKAIHIKPEKSIFVRELLESKEIDNRRAAQLKMILRDMIDQGEQKIILNLNEIESLDSATVGVLISIYAELKKKNGIFLIIFEKDEYVHKTLELSKIINLFPYVFNKKDVDKKVEELRSEIKEKLYKKY